MQEGLSDTRGPSRGHCPFSRQWETTCANIHPPFAPPTTVAGHLKHVATEALRSIRHRLLLFTGDSLDQQLFVAVACSALSLLESTGRGAYEFEPSWWAASSDGVLRKRCANASAPCHYSEACVSFGGLYRLCLCANVPTESCLVKYRFNSSQDILVQGTMAVHRLNEVPRHTSGAAGIIDKARTAELARWEVNSTLAKLAIYGISAGSGASASLMHSSYSPPKLIWKEATAQHFGHAGGHWDT